MIPVLDENGQQVKMIREIRNSNLTQQQLRMKSKQ